MVMVNLENEIWKDIEGYEGYYQISDFGRVKSIGYGDEKILKPNTTARGYMVVSLCINNKKDTKSIHRLVASAFLSHSSSGRDFVVDHIDNVKSNNHLTNLQVISFRENMSKDRVKLTSNFTGVSFNKERNKYRSAITINKKLIHIKYSASEQEASKSYIKALNVLNEKGEQAAREYIESEKERHRRNKYKGVYPNTSGPNFYSIVTIKGQTHRLGTFPSRELANEARVRFIKNKKNNN